MHPNAGGIDVGNESHFAAVPPDRDANAVQEFGGWTGDLQRMARWLQAGRIDTVAMQATGVYWIALYDILTQHGIKVTLANAHHTRNVPGRKTDVQESQWLMKLHTYGLLRDSFHLDERVQRVRTIWRLRDQHVQEASQAIQHMQKALTKMNIQLANVLSDISGVSGQAIIGAILKGERDPYQLADLKHQRVEASRAEVARSLEGNWREDVRLEWQQAVEAYEFAQWQRRTCDAKLEEYLTAWPTRTWNHGTNPAPAPATHRKAPSQRRAKPKGNAPALDLKAELQRIAGVDLTTLDGMDVMTAQTILTELGPDLSAFPSEDPFASWLGRSPSKDIRGGQVIGRGRRKVKNRVAQALRMAATTLRHSKSYLGARYRYLRNQFDIKTGAVKARARYLAVLVYRLLRYGQAWVDQGAKRFERQQDERELARLTAKAAARGLQLVPLGAQLP